MPLINGKTELEYLQSVFPIGSEVPVVIRKPAYNGKPGLYSVLRVVNGSKIKDQTTTVSEVMGQQALLFDLPHLTLRDKPVAFEYENEMRLVEHLATVLHKHPRSLKLQVV